MRQVLRYSLLQKKQLFLLFFASLFLLTGHGSLFLSRSWANFGLVLLNRLPPAGSAPIAKSAQAELMLRRAINHSDKDRSAWRGMGYALLSQGKEEEALAAWQRSEAMDRELMWKGDQALKARDYDEALAWYKRALILAPADERLHYYMGLVYLELKDARRALSLLQGVAKSSPEHRDYWYNLGRAYVMLQEYQQALHAWQQGLSGTSGEVGLSDLYFQIGHVRQQLLSPPDLEGAWSAYEAALLLDNYAARGNQKSETYYRRGVILAEWQQWDEAIQSYRQALTLDPDHYLAHISLANLLWQLDRNQEARALLLRAIERAPERKNAYLHLGHFFQAEGELEEARAMFAKVLELDPADERASQALSALDRDS